MHLDTALALNVSRDSVCNTCAEAPTVYVLSKDKTAAVFAVSSVASLSQNSMAVAKGKAASPMLFTHWRLLASELIFGSYFVSATHEDKRTTENTKTNFPKTFLTTAQAPERDRWTTILLFNYSNLKTWLTTCANCADKRHTLSILNNRLSSRHDCYVGSKWGAYLQTRKTSVH